MTLLAIILCLVCQLFLVVGRGDARGSRRIQVDEDSLATRYVTIARGRRLLSSHLEPIRRAG